MTRLRFRGAAEEAIALSKVNSVMQHVQLGKGVGSCFSSPILLNMDTAAPGIDISCCPAVRVQQAVMQLL